MRGLAFVLGISVVAVAPVSIALQQPAFTGRWLQKSPEPGSGGVGPVCGMSCSLTLDDNTLRVTGLDGGGARTFPLDGTRRTTVFRMGGVTAESTMVATWEGQTIVITQLQGEKLFSRSRLSIQDGQLTISATGRGRGGDGTTFIYARER